MEITLNHIKIRDLVSWYIDEKELGVSAYNWKLNIRPKYQREFIYSPEQRIAVIETILKNFPLNVMYWVKKERSNCKTTNNEVSLNSDRDDSFDYEVLDWQQRTISICSFKNGDFSIEMIKWDWNPKYFHNLPNDIQEKILDYELTIYTCEGSDSEKLEWFKTINIAGEKLNDQELRNAVYSGQWLTDAKKFFSKTGWPASGFWENYVVWKAIRQEILERTLKWISDGKIEKYMSEHQNDKDANELWTYFQKVINWAKIIFPNYRKEMKNVEWWELYNKFQNNSYNSNELEEKIKKLMIDEDVTNKKWIYEFLLSGDDKHLNIRSFSESQKSEVYEKQNRKCPHCVSKWNVKTEYNIAEMEWDHITPWKEGWKTNIENLQMLCKSCNRRKSDK